MARSSRCGAALIAVSLAGVILLAGCTVIGKPGVQFTAPPVTPKAIAAPTPVIRESFVPAVPCVPTGLYVPKAGIQSAGGKAAPITEYTDAHVAATGGVVEPSTLQEIDWWSGAGRPGASPSNTPATHPSGIDYTTMLYGHSWIHPAAFNGLRNLVSGDVVTVETACGTTFYYKVQNVITLPKGQFETSPQTGLDVAGRLVLSTCDRYPGYPTNKDTTENYVVIAQRFWPASNGGG